MPNAHPAIELKGLTKGFGSIVANQDIDLTVFNGEILALLGENGSGKTTLMNMLSGLYRPDAGEIYVSGRPVSIHSPHDAIALGIGMIHQHFKLVDVLSVQENIVLGTVGHFAGKRKLSREIRELCERFGLMIDEPTAVLTPQEIGRLFDILRKMREQGCAIIIITHKLNEVLEISDRVTILRKGRCIGTVETRSTTARELTERMVGASVDLSIHRPEPLRSGPMLDVHHLTVVNSDGVRALDDVNFSIASGEILGVAGVAGSGQKELCEAIAGLQPIAGGAILCEHTSLEGLSPREIIRRGISMSFIPEDRLGMGLVASMGMVDNMLLKDYQNQPGMLIRREGARNLANSLVKQLNISTPSIYTAVRKLSGGNVQKVLLGREIASNPRILITAYPVRGLDINSSMTIYRMLNDQKQKGVAVLYIGEDLDVLLELCDRILVLCGGRVTGIVDAAGVTKEQLGLLMAGQTAEEAMRNG
ncbi:MAG: Galactose/methyl galactoside import ATP-binding protein MglA [Firmicutes bacterium ADurb.Bin467]|nr:MAG: Galactose/methyl galactoside import ATP-binding protein MglA [Firmicutes bacterium ADurb.Bin467]